MRIRTFLNSWMLAITYEKARSRQLPFPGIPSTQSTTKLPCFPAAGS